MTSVDTGVLSSWPEALRLPIDAFLDRAERGLLSAGVVRPMRATVLKALEAEIVGRVTKTSAGADPKAEDVSATLKGMGVGEKEVGGCGRGDRAGVAAVYSFGDAARDRGARGGGVLHSVEFSAGDCVVFIHDAFFACGGACSGGLSA